MIVDFDEFSEMVERCCFNSWRSVIGMSNEEKICGVDSILFTRSEGKGKWEFSFALRLQGKWAQEKKDIEPVEFDPYNPPDPSDVEANMSPQNRASNISVELLSGVARKIGIRDVD